MRILTSFRVPTGTFIPAISKGFIGKTPNPKSQIPMNSQLPTPKGCPPWRRPEGGKRRVLCRDLSLAVPGRPRGRLDEHLRDVALRRLLQPFESGRRVHLDDHRTRRGFEDVDAGELKAR